MMKGLIVFGFLVAFSAARNEELAQNAKKAFVAIADQCEKETGADPAQIKAYLNRKQPTTAAGKCLLLCIHRELKMQNNEGKIDVGGFRKAADWVIEIYGAEFREKMNDLVKTCTTMKYSAKPCQAGVDFYNCYNNQAIQHKVPILLDL